MLHMPTYDALPDYWQHVVSEMAHEAREVVRAHGLRPPGDDRAAVFDEACAVLLREAMRSSITRAASTVGGTPPTPGGMAATSPKSGATAIRN